MSIFVNFLIFIHLIPAFLVFYIYYIIPYLELKKGASLNDYLNAVEFDGIPALTVCTLLPIFNWLIIMKYFQPDDYEDSISCKDYEKACKIRYYLFKLIAVLYGFIAEFIIAIWMLIVWIFGLKYVFKVIRKILTFKIK
ncbi:MAG: hypothetical protein [Vetruanivirus porcinprimi]|uniref:Transmembrane protein n=1 Tax=phage Lak_Megaphage_RVC_AP1_GC26 TaxID=3109224 RepID=A0ABZ0Z7V1_9CAUD|nr:MAG: hypothetical protein [phage Lak_Megaphage_RVC_AP1_GC26]